jgi:transcriptional regulator with XRE-family HTH domain
MSTTAADLRARRARLVITIEAVAARAGYTPQHVSDVERGKHPGSEKMLRAMSDAIDAIETERTATRDERESVLLTQ